MIKNSPLLSKLTREVIAKDFPDYFKNLKLYEALYKEACELGIFPLKEPLEGIETDIKIAKVVNSVHRIT